MQVSMWKSTSVKELLGFSVFLLGPELWHFLWGVLCRMVQAGLWWRREEGGSWVCADVWHSQQQGRLVQSLFKGSRLEGCLLKILRSNEMKHFIF